MPQPLRRGQGRIWAVARSSVLTIVFTLLGLFAYQQLLNFIFSEETNWNSVRVNLRLLFTQAYPRVRLPPGLDLARPGPHPQRRGPRPHESGPGHLDEEDRHLVRGLGRTCRARRVPASALRAQLGDDGTPFSRAPTPTVCLLARDGLGTLVYLDGSPAPSQGLSVVRESYGDAIASRSGWLLIGLVLIGLAAAIWFGLGDKRRRSTFLPAIPFSLAGIGALISTTWWCITGATTPSPPTRRRASAASTSNRASRWRRPPATHGPSCSRPRRGLPARLASPGQAPSSEAARAGADPGWFLAPFVTFFAILRGPNSIGVMSLPSMFRWLCLRHRRCRSDVVLTKPGIGELDGCSPCSSWPSPPSPGSPPLRLVRHAPEGAPELPAARPRCAARPNFIGEARQRLDASSTAGSARSRSST